MRGNEFLVNGLHVEYWWVMQVVIWYIIVSIIVFMKAIE